MGKNYYLEKEVLRRGFFSSKMGIGIRELQYFVQSAVEPNGTIEGDAEQRKEEIFLEGTEPGNQL